MPPEVIRNEPYSAKVDFWSLGCVIFELLTGKSPFHGANSNDTSTNWCYAGSSETFGGGAVGNPGATMSTCNGSFPNNN